MAYMNFLDVRDYFIDNDIVTINNIRWYDNMFVVDLNMSNKIGNYVINTNLISEKLTSIQWNKMQSVVTQQIIF